MFAKLVAVILAVAIVACSLLAMRQSRLQVASELARAQMRIVDQDHKLLKLRGQVAERIRPDAIHTLAANLGPLRPVITGERDPLADAIAFGNTNQTPGISPQSGLQSGPQPGVTRTARGSDTSKATENKAKTNKVATNTGKSNKAASDSNKSGKATPTSTKKSPTKPSTKTASKSSATKPSSGKASKETAKQNAQRVADARSARGGNR